MVEHLDVVEDGVGQFEPSPPFLAVKLLVLHARPEGLLHGIVKRVYGRTVYLGSHMRERLAKVVSVDWRISQRGDEIS